MEIIDNILQNVKSEKISQYLPANTDKYAFFDIETTGLSKNTSKIYLLGFVYYDDNIFKSRQFLAETNNDEYTLLKHASEFASQFNTLITFNGKAFDIPFFETRCKHNNIECSISDNLDIYKLIQPLRPIFCLDSMKQKSIESFLHIDRVDEMNGGELIEVFKHFAETHSLTDRQLLLQHNFDDICGMADILPILAYPAIFTNATYDHSYQIQQYKDFRGNEAFELIIDFNLEHPVPVEHTMHNDSIYLHVKDSHGTLKVPILTGTLKHFFDNYKDYFYLPAEDKVIHKSVGIYVDADSKTKCTKENCYVKKEGCFGPLYNNDISLPIFKNEYKTKETFFEITPKDIDGSIIEEYVRILFKKLSGK